MRAIFVLCLLLSACMEIQDVGEGVGVQRMTTSYEIVDLVEANHFKVFLKFNRPQQMLVRRNEIAGVDFAISVGDTYEDKNVVAGEIYTYQLGFNDKGKFTIDEEIRVQIPFDFYVSGLVAIDSESLLKKLANTRKLHFSYGSVLLTKGNSLTIRAQELQSDGGSILTFPEDQTADPGKPGRSGGNIVIEAAQASGYLSVVMRGEKGGRGSFGFNNDNGLGGRGGSGFSGGNSGSLYLGAMLGIKIAVKIIPGEGGTGGVGGVGYPRCHRNEDPSACLSEIRAASGENGLAGKPGKICYLENGWGC
jgi:hypothetical protein